VSGIESQIVGSEKLVGIFGYWPTFHDAEILGFHLDRGDVRPDDGVFKFPILTLRVHIFDMTREVDSRGYFVLRHHTLTTLKFSDVHELKAEGFNHQNAIMELVILEKTRTEGPSPYFAVTVEPAFGMGVVFECLGVEIVDAVPCSADGKPI
jgi:hypothetical protein